MDLDGTFFGFPRGYIYTSQKYAAQLANPKKAAGSFPKYHVSETRVVKLRGVESFRKMSRHHSSSPLNPSQTQKHGKSHLPLTCFLLRQKIRIVLIRKSWIHWDYSLENEQPEKHLGKEESFSKRPYWVSISIFGGVPFYVEVATPESTKSICRDFDVSPTQSIFLEDSAHFFRHHWIWHTRHSKSMCYAKYASFSNSKPAPQQKQKEPEI